MGVWDKINTPEGQAAIDRLAVLDFSREMAECRLRAMLLHPKKEIARLVERKAWRNPRDYDAGVESLKLR